MDDGVDGAGTRRPTAPSGPPLQKLDLHTPCLHRVGQVGQSLDHQGVRRRGTLAPKTPDGPSLGTTSPPDQPPSPRPQSSVQGWVFMKYPGSGVVATQRCAPGPGPCGTAVRCSSCSSGGHPPAEQLHPPCPRCRVVQCAGLYPSVQ